MIKRAIIIALAGMSFAHTACASDEPTVTNPFVGEERKPAPAVANIPLPSLPAIALPPAQEEFYDKNRGIFDSLRVVIKTEDRAILVATGTGGQQGQGVKNWLVKNGDEIVVNGRKIKVSLARDVVYLTDAGGNVAVIAGIEAPPAATPSTNQVTPVMHDSQNIPLSAGANIGAGGTIRGGQMPAGMR